MTVEELIAEWWGKPGGSERSNFAPFITDLCELLQVPRPGQSEKGKLGEYEFEGSVPKGSFRSLDASGSIDLYKRGHFIMEAKQSYLKPEQTDLDFGEPTGPQAPSGARYDKLMRDARLQAENYAKNLPASEPVAPFLIVCDIGRAFEIYHDAAGNGRGYTFFPDKQSYRIELKDLVSDKKLKGVDRPPLEMLKAIWSEPRSIDPRFQSADVTRTVAKRLASVSQYIEEGLKQKLKDLSARERSEEIEEAALFLMRILFCMFAEDIGLLPEGKFKDFLLRAESNDKLFQNQLPELWHKMGNPVANRFASAVEEDVAYFNGGLFESNRTYPLGGFVIHDLYEAAKQNWRKVEPAIFGTLLEQALTPEERAKLGAHYTPRPYVETLVRATIMDVLEPEWAAVEEEIGALLEADPAPLRPTASLRAPPSPAEGGGAEAALALAMAFHERLATIRVLDPACGTGNFLYVSMELMQALESRVIETIEMLGGKAEPKVGPHQFYGLEKNPRAAKIAELVLWIGWLRNRLHDDPDSVPQPVLAESASINFGRHGGYDAVLRMNALGEPDLASPMIPQWPDAEFIVGNPPFIGKGSAMREALGDDYVEALWRANPRVPKSADFVMQWWDRAACLLSSQDAKLKRFGLVTTNLIRGSLNRKVIEHHLQSEAPVSLIFAVPDHPWTKASKDAAAVRIAMSVAEAGKCKVGVSLAVKREVDLKTDDPIVELTPEIGVVHANLRSGTDLTSLVRLQANRGLSSNGMMLAGAGFKLTRSEAEHLRSLDGPQAPIRPYVAGAEIMQLPKGNSVIDLFGLEERDARTRFPASYSRLLHLVKPGRKGNRKTYRADRWWEFGENNPLMRESLTDVTRYIATTETTKHRTFQYLDSAVVPDHMIIAISLDDALFLGVLSSTFHLAWTIAISSPLGVATMAQGHRYNKSQIFDPFPFPDPTPEQRVVIAELAEELDATRKAALAETDKLTMTELYNLRARLKSGEPMSEAEQRRATKARAAIVDLLHEQIDQAVADAYGWGEEWKAGTLGPSEIVARLVALNHERAAEEAEGKVRWLRPEYQIPRFAKQK